MDSAADRLDDASAGGVRSRIIAAAAALIAEGGAQAVTTRAVSAAASVQAPTLYRLFGDKRGLLDAVAEEAFSAYLDRKGRHRPSGDPVEDLRQGWDAHVAFGLTHPGIFALVSAPYPQAPLRAASAGLEFLRKAVRRVAINGRLKIDEERAVDLVRSAATGAVLTLMETPEADHGDLSRLAREAVMATIIDGQAPPADIGVRGHAAALRAGLGEVKCLTSGERALLDELLKRISAESQDQ